jgi:hypothetical protein
MRVSTGDKGMLHREGGTNCLSRRMARINRSHIAAAVR